MKYRLKPAGDQCILVEFDEKIDKTTNLEVRNLANFIENEVEEGFGEVILGYRTLLIHYNPLKLSYEDVMSKIKVWEKQIDHLNQQQYRVLEIPVLYGGEWGPDLKDVAEHNNLKPEDVITIHSNTEYLVFFLGFTPGFPLMGKISDSIAMPRLSNPRLLIPGGSVGIANHQTGIYPVDSPGGWRLIGRTPIRLYDPKQNKPFLLNAGDYVKFRSIQENEYHEIKDKVDKREYELTIRIK